MTGADLTAIGPGFERAMSTLTLAVGLLKRCPPADVDQQTRLSMAVGQLETIETRAGRSIQAALDIAA